MTLAEQILETRKGESTSINWDWLLVNDSHKLNEWHINKEQKEKLIFIVDHVVPSDSEKTDLVQTAMRQMAKDNQIRFYEGKGVCYPLMIEELITPGQTVCAMGKRACTLGALGVFSLCVPPAAFSAALNGDGYEIKVPSTVMIRIHGCLKPNVGSRDVALFIMKHAPACINSNTVIQIGGEGLEQLCISDRITLCNTLAETNALTVLVEADKVTDEYLAEKKRGARKSFSPSSDNDFQSICDIDLGEIEPMMVYPHDFSSIDLIDCNKDIDIQAAFVGGCSGGSIEDIRSAAEILQGKQVAKNMRFIIAPNTQSCYMQALTEGLVDIIVDSGAMIVNPHCSTCFGKSQGHITVNEGMVSTGVCNAAGCAGSEQGYVYLASAQTVAQSALSGKIVRKG